MSEEQLTIPSHEGSDASEDPVECLGRTFPTDDARREYYLDQLRQKLADPDFRKTAGFPKGSDEDILRMSDPPYHTACPNPFLADFLSCHATPHSSDEDYHRAPLAVDISEGKTNPLYRAHGYHTKVPHLAIVPYILHYTSPGDVVLDGFCGSGMTGVAAQWCGTAPPEYRDRIQAQSQIGGSTEPEWGARYAILGDLSPAATFIASNYNVPFDVDAFSAAAAGLLEVVQDDVGWMYETRHSDNVTQGCITYTVWSEVFTCSECAGEVVFFREAFDATSGKIRPKFSCPHCSVSLSKKSNLGRLLETIIDPATDRPWQRIRLEPVSIAYTSDGKGFTKEPDREDLDRLDQITALPLPGETPLAAFPIDEMYHGTRLAPKGFTHVYHMFLPRAAHALSAAWRVATGSADPRIARMLVFAVEQSIPGMSLMNRHHVVGRANVNQHMTGVYYIPSVPEETAFRRNIEGKLQRLVQAFDTFRATAGQTIVTTGNCADVDIPDNSIDYVFTDPPFGENLHYADLNFLVESWHGVHTSTPLEAIIDRRKNKDILAYQDLMRRCFQAYYRVLKPGRWMTVVFHNSRNSVWNAIQEAMLSSGFVVADVRTLDKQQGSYRQITSTAVKQDLVISAYKPRDEVAVSVGSATGNVDRMWDMVRYHLRQVPVFVGNSATAEVVVERQPHRLFDRMVAFHIQRGLSVPLSIAGFRAGLIERFPERDGMHFLPEQVVEYDRQRMKVDELRQLELFVTDEASSIQWVRRQLDGKPQTFQDLQPQFMREVQAWVKHEKTVELSDVIEEGFLCYTGEGPVPSQIHGYLSSNFRHLRNLDKHDARLQAEAMDRWYVPDPNKQADLDQVRTRSLLREFEEYRTGTTAKLRQFRTEAVRAGFTAAYGEQDWETIVLVANRLPASVLEEDADLLMYYDVARMRGSND